ncbi:MAG: Crp/Fnr family transcriptional regulator [Rhodospirillaceae bacterium]|nr:Crp/Fnr family transcriptional regulator [Rhodospirillaceae bacterium]
MTLIEDKKHISASFVRKLRHGAALTMEDEVSLARLVQNPRPVPARADVMSHNAKPRYLPLILEGWACRYKILENGKRQILAVYLPGDLCEPFGLLPRVTEHAIGALTDVVYAAVPLDALRTTAHDNPRIAQALWWDLLMASGIEREHLVNLGRRTATERIAHLFCELQIRLNMIGLGERNRFEFPVPQLDVSDLMGLSAVHVNRCLQELKSLGLISQRGRHVTLHDVEKLRDFALFNANYLNSSQPSAFSKD